MMLVGIIGVKGSGKTTLANYLGKKGFHIYSFADALKDVAKIFGFTEKELNGTQLDKLNINKNLGICSREFLQKFGTEICIYNLPQVIPGINIKNGSIWIDILERKIKSDTGSRICISDVRFENEAQFIINNNGILIKIIREVPTDVHSEHISEQMNINISPIHIINNNSSLIDMYKHVDNIISKYN